MSPTITYTSAGLVQTVTDAQSNVTTYGYDVRGNGRLSTTTVQYAFLTGQTFTNTYTYDAASNRASFTAPDGSTTATPEPVPSGVEGAR